MTTVQHLTEKLRTLSPELLEDVDTFIEFLLHKHHHQSKISVLDLLAQPLDEQAFQTAEDVRVYLQTERASWDR